jgi:hypothetical protein
MSEWCDSEADNFYPLKVFLNVCRSHVQISTVNSGAAITAKFCCNQWSTEALNSVDHWLYSAITLEAGPAQTLPNEDASRNSHKRTFEKNSLISYTVRMHPNANEWNILVSHCDKILSSPRKLQSQTNHSQTRSAWKRVEGARVSVHSLSALNYRAVSCLLPWW